MNSLVLQELEVVILAFQKGAAVIKWEALLEEHTIKIII
jgi:hypothetical protein